MASNGKAAHQPILLLVWAILPASLGLIGFFLPIGDVNVIKNIGLYTLEPRFEARTWMLGAKKLWSDD